MRTSMIEASKVYYNTNSDGATEGEIQTGALQRIALATEMMAKNYREMQESLAWYKTAYQEHEAAIYKLNRSNAALRGHINRLKRLKNNTDAVL